MHTTSVPSFKNLLHTFCGNIKGTCLEDRKKLMDTFFGEMFLNGCIEETMFDRHEVPKDTNSKGEVIENPVQFLLKIVIVP